MTELEKFGHFCYNNSVNKKGAFMFSILRSVTRGGGII